MQAGTCVGAKERLGLNCDSDIAISVVLPILGPGVTSTSVFTRERVHVYAIATQACPRDFSRAVSASVDHEMRCSKRCALGFSFPKVRSILEALAWSDRCHVNPGHEGDSRRVSRVSGSAACERRARM